MKWIIELPDDFDGSIDGRKSIDRWANMVEVILPSVANAKKAVEVRLEETEEPGAGVVDDTGKYYFKGIAKLFAVEE